MLMRLFSDSMYITFTSSSKRPALINALAFNFALPQSRYRRTANPKCPELFQQLSLFQQVTCIIAAALDASSSRVVYLYIS
ncbi:hypothetical protein ACLB2K_025800 [Fragaria x ananassa]